MIEINEKQCVGCGQCVSVCPFTVLRVNKETNRAECMKKDCLSCMHCAAICPQQAILFQGRPAVLSEVQDLTGFHTKDLESFIYQRRSYRKFFKKPIPHEIIMKALNAAMIAPSAKNEHPVQWLLIQSEAVQQLLMEAILEYCAKQHVSSEVLSEYKNHNNPVIGENAVLLVGICKKNALNPAQDTAIALTTAELILQAHGIGTCWAGYLTRFLNTIPACRKIIQLEEDFAVYGALMMGYPSTLPYRFVPLRVKNVILRTI